MNPRKFSLTTIWQISIFIAVLAVGPSALAQTEQVLWSFGRPHDGSSPSGGLVADSAGNLYGVTIVGGSAKVGTVYQLSPLSGGGGREAVLYSFTGNGSNADGARPFGELVLDPAGNLYGSTTMGGPLNQGTVFELSPPASPGGAWTETVLYTFQGGSDGSLPGAPIFDHAGNLYGVTAEGGNHGAAMCVTYGGCGTIFELSPPDSPGGSWTETVLYDFLGDSDGALPEGSLAFDSTGNLYGTTSYGGGVGCPGNIGCGTVFELAPPPQPGGPWTETLLHTFQGPDGATPSVGLVVSTSGDLAGTTSSGGPNATGVVFGMSPPSHPGAAWGYQILWDFHNDGAQPESPLTIGDGGVLFGATYGGGTGNGTVFELKGSGCCTWNQAGFYAFPDCLGGTNG